MYYTFYITASATTNIHITQDNYTLLSTLWAIKSIFNDAAS